MSPLAPSLSEPQALPSPRLPAMQRAPGLLPGLGLFGSLKKLRRDPYLEVQGTYDLALYLYLSLSLLLFFQEALFGPPLGVSRELGSMLY